MLNGDGNENGKKNQYVWSRAIALGLISKKQQQQQKKTTLHVLNSVLNSAHFFVHFFHVKPPSETSQLHVLWRKCRCAHSEFCCLCFCSLFSFFTAAHFHLAFVQILTASIKFSCCSSNEIRLPCFLSLALAFCRYFSRWALLPCRLLSRFLCLSLSIYSRFVDIIIFMYFPKKVPLAWFARSG